VLFGKCDIVFSGTRTSTTISSTFNKTATNDAGTDEN